MIFKKNRLVRGANRFWVEVGFVTVGVASFRQYLVGLRAEKTSKEDEETQYAHRYGGVGHVENGPEKLEMLTAPKRQPIRKKSFVHREVEHIHHLSVEEPGISAPFGEQRGHTAVIGRLGKDKAVEGAVKDIADGPGEDEGEAGNQAKRDFGPKQQSQVVQQETNRSDAEKAEGELAIITAERDAKGHPFVFDKMDTCPILPKQMDFIAVGEVGFYPNFQPLVNYQNADNNQGYFE